jgi:hypothetical protein
MFAFLDKLLCAGRAKPAGRALAGSSKGVLCCLTLGIKGYSHTRFCVTTRPGKRMCK